MCQLVCLVVSFLRARACSGGDGWSSAHWLMAEKSVCMVLLGDTSHRVWNDTELAMRDTNIWQIALMCVVLCNIDEGAWRDSRWWEQARDAVCEHTQVAGLECPLLAGVAATILEERGEEYLVGGDLVQTRLQEIMQETVQHKMVRIGMSRLFAYFDAMQMMLKQWTTRYFIYAYVALQLGQLSEVTTAKFAKVHIRRIQAGEDVAKSTTTHDKEEVRKMRSSCANTMVYAIKLLSDPELKKLNTGLCALTRPMREWHTAQSKLNRSSAESLKFYVSMATGGIWESLNMTMKTLQSPAFWDVVGLNSLRQPCRRPADPECPAVQEDNELSSTLADYCFNLVGRRLASLSWHEGYPGVLAALSAPEAGMAVAARMKQDMGDWATIGELPGAFWNKFRGRSSLNFLVVVKFAKMLQESDWEITPEISKQVSQSFSGVTQTKIVEDGFRKEKQA